jgi:PadR family transcriptional regulator, regulatory protein PadR
MKRDSGFFINAGPSMMVLAMLREQGRYGYDIAKELSRITDGRLNFQQGTLYPILHKLEKDGLIKGVWEEPEGERSRRIYVLTDKGRTEADRQIEAWTQYAQAVHRVIQETTG